MTQTQPGLRALGSWEYWDVDCKKGCMSMKKCKPVKSFGKYRCFWPSFAFRTIWLMHRLECAP
jgi:hypothetical protein